MCLLQGGGRAGEHERESESSDIYSYKDTHLIGSGPHPYDSSRLHLQIQSYLGLGLQDVNFGETKIHAYQLLSQCLALLLGLYGYCYYHPMTDREIDMQGKASDLPGVTGVWGTARMYTRQKSPEPVPSTPGLHFSEGLWHESRFPAVS